MLTAYILELNMSFGDNVKRLRRDKGWTQNQLADASGLKSSHIPKIENEKTEPKLSTIYKLISAFDCSADALMFDYEKIGLDGILKSTLERTMSLPEINKKIIIDVVDKYCGACGLASAFTPENQNWLGFRTRTEANVSPLPEEQFNELSTKN